MITVAKWISIPVIASACSCYSLKSYATNYHSPLPVLKKIHIDFSRLPDSILTNTPTTENLEDEEINQLITTIDNNVHDRENKRTMLHLLRTLTVTRAFRNKRYKARLYEDMANISATMKLYPLAMQLCSKEALEKTAIEDESDTQKNMSEEINTNNTAVVTTEKKAEDSEPVSIDDILNSFDDDKQASDYALIVHVKQPVNGKRKSFTGIDNVGHMFITLIKYNTDKTYVTRSFGFYPQKTNLLAGTPFKPTAQPQIKDDALHDWDEAIGKFISYRRFKKIIKVLCRYEYKMYDLNENNCTDFGLTVASLSGIQIDKTKGTWPFGKGNNPANTGQSILENKIAGDDEVFFVFRK